MTNRQQSEKDFLQESFNPQIAVCCSYDAEVICRKNNLTFVELVQPFSKYNGEIKIIDPSNNHIILKKFKVDIKDINQFDPQSIGLQKESDFCISSNVDESKFSTTTIENSLYKITTNLSTPWFEKWRNNFIKYCSKEDHEFIRNFLGCIFVVSTSHLDPLDQFKKLVVHEQTDSNHNTFKKWFFPNFSNIYKYFVLLHDVQEGEISKAHLIYESLKNVFGSSNCHLLQINSKSFEIQNIDKISQEFDPWSSYCKISDSFTILDSLKLNNLRKESIDESINKNINQHQERHGMCLSLSDHDRIKTFLSEFLTRGLIPYVEKTIRVLNEQFQSKKNILKGFSISKKFFGLTNSSLKTSPSPIMSLSNLTSNSQDPSNILSKTSSNLGISNQFIHTNDDFSTKRLGDLTFLFQLYEMSLSYYLSFKKEITGILSSLNAGSDAISVKLHYASVLEMISITSYLNYLNSTNDKFLLSNISSVSFNKNFNTHFIEEALFLYFNDCKNFSYSIRCVLFSTEILRTISNYSKAASQYIYINQDEHSLRRCLFLEQAAYCYLNQPLNFRKFAFLINLAGENFEKNGKKIHSVFAFKNALQIYSNKGWTKILDRINYSLSIQNYNLDNIDDAIKYLEEILSRKYVDKLISSKIDRKKKYDQNDSSFDFLVLKNLIDFSDSLKLDNNFGIDQLPRIDSESLKISLNPMENFDIKPNSICLNIEENLELLQNKYNDWFENNSLKKIWKKLERIIFISNFGNLPSIFFKPQTSVYDISNINNIKPQIFSNEFIEISFKAINYLNIDLILKDCVLLWRFVQQNTSEENENSVISNDNNQNLDFVETKSIDQILIPSKNKKRIRLLIRPKKQTGNLFILGIKYELGINNEAKFCGKQFFKFQETHNNISNKIHCKTKSFEYANFKVVKKMPLLQINIESFPEKMFCNQIHKIKFFLMNLSQDSSISNIKVAINKSVNSNIKFIKSKWASGNDHVFKSENVEKEIIEKLDSVIIEPKTTFVLEAWIQTNEIPEKNFFNFLFAYQESNKTSINESNTKSKISEYRTIRFSLVIENLNITFENKIRFKHFLNSSFFLGNVEISCKKPLKEMLISNVSIITESWKISSFKKKYSEKNTSENSNTLSFVFKGESLNSIKIDDKSILSLCSDFFKNDSRTLEYWNDLNEIIVFFCKNNQKNICENNYLILNFLIMIRIDGKMVYILKEIMSSTNIIPKFHLRKTINNNDKLSNYFSKETKNSLKF